MPTEGEIEQAIADARKIIRIKFASESRRKWVDQAHDKAVDAVLRASESHDETRPFLPYARSCIRRALSDLLKSVGNRPGASRLIDDADAASKIAINALPADRIATLTQLQQETLRRKYEARESYSQIGRSRGVTKQAVQRIHKRALIKLKKQIS